MNWIKCHKTFNSICMGSGIANATPKFNDVIIRRNSMKKKTWKKKWKKPKPDK